MTKYDVGTLYRERILPGFSFYLATLFVPTALFLIVLAFDDFAALLAFISSEVVIIALSILLAPGIEVSKSALRVGRAIVPRGFIGSVAIIKNTDTFAERGPRMNTKAYALFQIGVKDLVKIEIIDPNDPTPYWLFASRNPTSLVAALSQTS